MTNLFSVFAQLALDDIQYRRDIRRAEAETRAKAEEMGDAFEGMERKSGRSLTRLGMKLTSMGTTLTTYLTPTIKALGGVTIAAASDAEETGSKFDTVFRDIGDTATRAAERLSDSFDLSSTSARRLLGDTGDLLTGFGFAQDHALDLSESVAELGVDLASFTNYAGGAEGATAALTKAMLGETEGLKALGIAISQADVETEILAMTQEGLTFATERQAKAEATLRLAYRQSANAVGDYERTSGSFANQSRALRESLNELGVTIGEVILPHATRVVSVVRSIVDWFNDLHPAVHRAVVIAGGFAAALGPVLIVTGQVIANLQTVIRTIAVMRTAMLAASGPVGWVALAATAVFGLATSFAGAHRRERESLAGSVGVAREALDDFKEGVGGSGLGMLGALDDLIAKTDGPTKEALIGMRDELVHTGEIGEESMESLERIMGEVADGATESLGEVKTASDFVRDALAANDGDSFVDALDKLIAASDDDTRPALERLRADLESTGDDAWEAAQDMLAAVEAFREWRRATGPGALGRWTETFLPSPAMTLMKAFDNQSGESHLAAYNAALDDMDLQAALDAVEDAIATGIALGYEDAARGRLEPLVDALRQEIVAQADAAKARERDPRPPGAPDRPPGATGPGSPEQVAQDLVREGLVDVNAWTERLTDEVILTQEKTAEEALGLLEPRRMELVREIREMDFGSLDYQIAEGQIAVLDGTIGKLRQIHTEEVSLEQARRDAEDAEQARQTAANERFDRTKVQVEAEQALEEQTARYAEEAAAATQDAANERFDAYKEVYDLTQELDEGAARAAEEQAEREAQAARDAANERFDIYKRRVEVEQALDAGAERAAEEQAEREAQAEQDAANERFDAYKRQYDAEVALEEQTKRYEQEAVEAAEQAKRDAANDRFDEYARRLEAQRALEEQTRDYLLSDIGASLISDRGRTRDQESDGGLGRARLLQGIGAGAISDRGRRRDQQGDGGLAEARSMQLQEKVEEVVASLEAAEHAAGVLEATTVTGADALKTMFSEGLHPFIDQIVGASPLVGAALTGLEAQFNAAGDKVGMSFDPMTAFASILATALGESEAFATVMEKVNGILDPIVGMFDTLLTALMPLIDVVIALAETALKPLVWLVETVVAPVLDAFASAVEAVWNFFANLIPGMDPTNSKVPFEEMGIIEGLEFRLGELDEAIREERDLDELARLQNERDAVQRELDRVRNWNTADWGDPNENRGDRPDPDAGDDDGGREGRDRTRSGPEPQTFGGTPQAVQFAVATPLVEAAVMFSDAVDTMGDIFGTAGGPTSGFNVLPPFTDAIERMTPVLERLLAEGVSINVAGGSARGGGLGHLRGY